MVTDFLFPFRPPHGSDTAEVLVAGKFLLFGIPMLPDAGASLRRNGNMLHVPFPKGFVTHSSVKGTIGRYLVNPCFRGYLGKERCKHFAISGVITSYIAKEDVPRRFVYAKVHFLPSSVL